MKVIPLFFVFSLATLLIACGKDKFETKPRLEIKDYSSRVVKQGDVLRIRLNYFDKEGDLNEAPVFGSIKRLNQFPIGSGDPDLPDIFSENLPDYPANDNGEISFELPYNRLKESSIEDDTLIFRFAVTDRAGNNSDTITTDPVVIDLP